MDLKLKGKKVIVLASSKGLGAGIAEAFAGEGADVVITGRSEESLRDRASLIEQKTGRSVLTAAVDLTRQKSIEDMIKKAAENLGGVDILINNTGGPPAGSFRKLSEEDWDDAYSLTLRSYITAVRSVLPFMEKNGGRILNVTSSSIKQPVEDLILSNTFRMGVLGLTKTLSKELAEDNILINTVGPGRIETERVQQIDAKKAEKSGKTPEEVKAESEASIPLARYGQPEEFASLVVFLASPKNTYTTGQHLVIDGGMTNAY
jgi:3-oxoacyl-[acyl-carrier protein] reductase